MSKIDKLIKVGSKNPNFAHGCTQIIHAKVIKASTFNELVCRDRKCDNCCMHTKHLVKLDRLGASNEQIKNCNSRD